MSIDLKRPATPAALDGYRYVRQLEEIIRGMRVGYRKVPERLRVAFDEALRDSADLPSDWRDA